MKPIKFIDTETVSDDAQSTQESGLTNSNMDPARYNAQAILHLLLNSGKPAVLIARDWHVFGVPYTFEDLERYREVAIAAGCCIVTIAQAADGGLEHLFFMARSEGLRYQDYIACIDETESGRGFALSAFRNRAPVQFTDETIQSRSSDT